VRSSVQRKAVRLEDSYGTSLRAIIGRGQRPSVLSARTGSGGPRVLFPQPFSQHRAVQTRALLEQCADGQKNPTRPPALRNRCKCVTPMRSLEPGLPAMHAAPTVAHCWGLAKRPVVGGAGTYRARRRRSGFRGCLSRVRGRRASAAYWRNREIFVGL